MQVILSIFYEIRNRKTQDAVSPEESQTGHMLIRTSFTGVRY